MPQNNKKTICFVHYGIGWRDGVNTVIKTLVDGIQEENPRLGFRFIGGEVKERFLEGADYIEIPELLPVEDDLNKSEIEKRGLAIAQKIAEATEGSDVVVIENPFVGEYHLSAMLGFSIYAKQFKPSGTKIFFRIHDLYVDSPHYRDGAWKSFSSSEIENIVRGEGVDGFLIINHELKEKLIQEGVAAEKIFYLSNGVDGEKFNQRLESEETEAIRAGLGISDKEAKILLYPVRVVPRKNIEEAILLVNYVRQITGENYILVVPGKVDKYDPLSQGYYDVLEKIVLVAGFPIIFTKKPLPLKRRYSASGAVEEYSVGDLYQASFATVMTSLREGFGYPFLECWFAGKIVVGRRIQNIVDDFEKSGLSFEWLYDNFLLNNRDVVNAEDEKSFKRAKRVLEIFRDKELKERILELNKDDVLKQVEVLRDRTRREKIIKENLEAAKNIYEVSEVAKQFLELIQGAAPVAGAAPLGHYKSCEIVVGIPSYNEADSISNVVKVVDEGLVKYFSGRRAVIINSDNNSSDGTSEVFLGVKTKTPKIYISTPPGVKGKGNNFRNLFLKMKELGADATMVVDADLKSITPEWVKCLIEPMMDGYDYITPIYARDKYDGSITNHLCYPIVYGLLGYDIRQPIGGDFGFSGRMADYWLEQEWTEEVGKFGIDIFMTMNAIKFGAKLGQVDLGFKIHKTSAPKLDNMFLEVASSLFSFLPKERAAEIQKPPLVCSISDEEGFSLDDFNQKESTAREKEEINEKIAVEFKENYSVLKSFIPEEIRVGLEREFFEEKSFGIDGELWAKSVYCLLGAFRDGADKKAVLKLLRALFFARRNVFVEEIRGKSYNDLEKIIQREANYFLDLL
ncbi:glycosyltransferase [Patescibacteria group bacterium]|nr:glycosyltransferase [Patescibacteria group bacterium]